MANAIALARRRHFEVVWEPAFAARIGPEWRGVLTGSKLEGGGRKNSPRVIECASTWNKAAEQERARRESLHSVA